MLEKLDSKLGGSMGFPPKKWFGNKSKDFLEKRREELEAYLNQIKNSAGVPLYYVIRDATKET